MKKLYIFLLVAAAILLSGCTSPDQPPSKTTSSIEITAVPTQAVQSQQTAIGSSNISIPVIRATTPLPSTPLNASTSVESSTSLAWCTPGNTIDVNILNQQKTFTIKGVVTKDGKQACEASNIENGVTTTKYFSEDGRYSSMTSVGNNSSASASASTS